MQNMLDASTKLLDYQKEAIKFCLSNKRVLLNLPAGSGKTLIGLFSSIQLKRVLVICPAFLRINWIYETRKWFPNYNSGSRVIIKEVEDAICIRKTLEIFAVVGYSFFERGQKVKALEQQWNMVICDESQYLRLWKSTRTKNVIRKICKKADRLIFMTATPLVTSAADLHPTFSVMQPGMWGNYGEFCRKYCNSEFSPFEYNKVRYFGISKANSFELKAKSKAFIFTRKKAVILNQLPPKQVITLPLDIGKCKEFDESVKEMIGRMRSEDDLDPSIKTERERVGLKKVKLILEFLESFPRSEPIVIFAWHRKVLLALCEGLAKLKFKPRLIIGGMSESKRMQKVEDFQEGKFKRFVVSIAAGGLGINLQRASTGIFVELPYSNAEFEQCSDRIHRLGSKRSVSIYKTIAVGSIDEQIDSVITEKRESAKHAGVLT